MSDTAPTRNPFATSFQALPQSLPIFPLAGVLLLPGARLPLNIFEPRYLAMVSDALSSPRLIGMVQPVRPGGFAGDGMSEGGAAPAVQPVGCVGRIVSFSETGDGRVLLTLAGQCRFRIVEELPVADGGYRRVRADYARFRADMDESETALDRPRLLAALKRYFAANDLSTDWAALERIDDGALVNTVSIVAPFDPAEKQALLEAEDGTRRGKLLIGLLESAALALDQPGGPPRH
ncbi:MAG: LON peptidase substrate-binding domain-containing protein [Reyranellaceae bacterium]